MKASLATVAIALLALGAACGGDDGGGDDTASTSAPESTEGSTDPSTPGSTTAPSTDGGTETPPDDLASFATIADLDGALDAGGVVCELEYDGLTDDDGNEVSTCTIEGSQAFLSIFADPSTVSEVVTAHEADAQVALAYGANWTIELTPPSESTATSAAAIAQATGGSVGPAGADGDSTSTSDG